MGEPKDLEITKEDTQIALSPADRFMSMVERATFDPNFDPAKLQIMMDMQFRWDAEQRRLKFEKALEKFKANKPLIERTKKVVIATRDGGYMTYSHPELDKACDLIIPALGEVGITHSWKTGSGENGRIRVTCVLKGFGHTEEIATLEGPPDASGSKNNVQAIGSTVFYLERYTLLGGLGIAPRGRDDDGKTEGMPEETIGDYCAALKDAPTLPKLQALCKEAVEKANHLNDVNAKERFRKVYEETKLKLRQEGAQ